MKEDTSYQTWSALTSSSYNKMYKQNAPTTKAWNVDTVLRRDERNTVRSVLTISFRGKNSLQFIVNISTNSQ